MNRDEILKLAEQAELSSNGPTKNEGYRRVQETIQNQCLHFAELLFAHWDNETKPAKVSALEFVTIVMEKEHLIGRPIIWAEWPNKEQA
jgi:hypothetical protein